MADDNWREALVEQLCRMAMNIVEDEHGSAEGRRLLGFNTKQEFIDAGWKNYRTQMEPAIDIVLNEAVRKLLGLTRKRP